MKKRDSILKTLQRSNTQIDSAIRLMSNDGIKSMKDFPPQGELSSYSILQKSSSHRKDKFQKSCGRQSLQLQPYPFRLSTMVSNDKNSNLKETLMPIVADPVTRKISQSSIATQIDEKSEISYSKTSLSNNSLEDSIRRKTITSNSVDSVSNSSNKSDSKKKLNIGLQMKKVSTQIVPKKVSQESLINKVLKRDDDQSLAPPSMSQLNQSVDGITKAEVIKSKKPVKAFNYHSLQSQLINSKPRYAQATT